MAPRRVVITGLGVVSPAGCGVEAFWSAVLEPKPAFKRVSSFDVSGYRTEVGAEVSGFAPRGCLAYAAEAARQALAGNSVDPARTGVVLGTTSGEQAALEEAFASGADPAPLAPGGLSAGLARMLGLGGPALTATSACTAGNFALAWARDRIAAGRADAMLAGGADVFNRTVFAGFSRLLAIAPQACAPFSKGRAGLIPSEGAGMLLLEEEEAARRRGAKIYGELLGVGVSSDARHVTMPDVAGVRRAIEDCLAAAGLRPDEVGYVSAHGTGTPANDKTESAALRAVFGERVPPVSSIKSVLGHAMGAATALEAVACALALDTGLVPPTAGFTPGDPDCALDYVPEGPRRVDPSVVLSDGFAFGGSNAVAALAKPGRALPQAQPARVVVTAAAYCEEGDPQALLPDKDLGVLDGPISLALCGAKRALDEAGLQGSERVGIILDSSGELGSLRRFYDDLAGQGPTGVEPALFPNILANAAASRAAIVLGLKRLNASLGGAFPGGESAVACGFDFVRAHPEAAILCGGVDGEARAGVAPSAAFLVLEGLEAARARGARVLMELAGVEEGFDGKSGKSACGCLIEAVKKGKAVEVSAHSRWGSWVKLKLTMVG